MGQQLSNLRSAAQRRALAMCVFARSGAEDAPGHAKIAGPAAASASVGAQLAQRSGQPCSGAYRTQRPRLITEIPRPPNPIRSHWRGSREPGLPEKGCELRSPHTFAMRRSRGVTCAAMLSVAGLSATALTQSRTRDPVMNLTRDALDARARWRGGAGARVRAGHSRPGVRAPECIRNNRQPGPAPLWPAMATVGDGATTDSH